MGNKVKGYIVTLSNDLDEESSELIINAIKMIRGVISVKSSVVDSNDHINRMRIKNEFNNKILDLYREL